MTFTYHPSDNPFFSPTEAANRRNEQLEKELLEKKLILIEKINSKLVEDEEVSLILSNFEYKILHSDNLFQKLGEIGWEVELFELHGSWKLEVYIKDKQNR